MIPVVWGAQMEPKLVHLEPKIAHSEPKMTRLESKIASWSLPAHPPESPGRFPGRARLPGSLPGNPWSPSIAPRRPLLNPRESTASTDTTAGAPCLSNYSKSPNVEDIASSLSCYAAVTSQTAVTWPADNCRAHRQRCDIASSTTAVALPPAVTSPVAESSPAAVISLAWC